MPLVNDGKVVAPRVVICEMNGRNRIDDKNTVIKKLCSQNTVARLSRKLSFQAMILYTDILLSLTEALVG